VGDRAALRPVRRSPGLRTLLAAEIVYNDLISRTQGGAEELPHPRQEHFAVHGIVPDHRRGQTIMPQSTYKSSRFPMSLGRHSDAALAFWSAAIAPRHVGRSPGFNEKHQAVDVHDSLCLRLGASRREYVRAFLLPGVQSFLKVSFHLFNWCHKAPILAANPCGANRCCNSDKIRSGCCAIQARNRGSASASRDRRWPPIGKPQRSPVFCIRSRI
jgi:hypothetical protein